MIYYEYSLQTTSKTWQTITWFDSIVPRDKTYVLLKENKSFSYYKNRFDQTIRVRKQGIDCGRSVKNV